MFENLTAEVVQLPRVQRNADEDNPFAAMLTESFKEENPARKGRKVTIPGENVATALRLIRRAAEHLELGARIIVQDSKGKKLTAEDVKGLEEKKSKAQIAVLFQAKERRSYTRKSKTADTETPAHPGTVESTPAQ